MNKPIKKISLILILLLLLPFIFISYREFVSIDENEKILSEAYNNQLESILFSVNQYSEDIVRSWLQKLETALARNAVEANPKPDLKILFSEASALKKIFVSDSLDKNSFLISPAGTSVLIDRIKMTGVLDSTGLKLLDRLYRYSGAGYKKIEPLPSNADSLHYFIFIFSDSKYCLAAIDKNLFATRYLSAKLQNIGGNRFSAVIFNNSTGRKIYQTAEVDLADIEQSKSLWLIPEYSLGIRLKGTTVLELVKERTNAGRMLLITFVVMMIVVSVYAFRNIKKEVELAQIKSEFVSNVSHELRTPLALISMFAEMLAMGRVKSEEKKNEYYNIIYSETERLSKIVNKILGFSKIESGKLKFNFALHDLNDITAKVFDTYKFHLGNNGFEFQFEPAGKTLQVKADSEAVAEALINLIDNAVKYSGKNKKVLIRTGRRGDFCFVEVEDAGIGITRADQKRIFDKFYRVLSNNVHNAKGTGLGLTLVKQIMEAHGGMVELESESGKGSKFRLLFKSSD